MKTLTTLIISMFLVLTAGCSATGQARAADDDYFTQAELDSMLAPVALYPDSVLSHVLIAATYPLEVIQAARWTRQHPGLRGEDAVAAVEHRNWDPSVKALVAFPDLLERMDDDLDWTQRLGDAFLLQEEEVIASIQYLRSEAYSQGHLRSNDRVKIVREKEYIYIEPARTRVVYVPYYDPRVIYTNWRWSSYRPHYWHRPSGFSVSVNFHWGRPYHIRPSFYFSSFHWPTRKVVVVNHHHHYYRDRRFHSGRDVARFKEARHWKHDPKHRRGVSYRGRVAETRFVESARSASTTRKNSKSISRGETTRSNRREWAAQRRSSQSFERESSVRDRGSSRSQRVADLRGSRSESRASSRIGGSETRAASRSRGDSSLQARRSERSSSRESSARTVTGRAPARAESRERAAASSRSSDARAARISESLRSGSSSRAAASSRSRAADRSSSSRLSSSRSSRTESNRSSISIPDGLSARSRSGREGSSAPSRSRATRSVSPGRSSSLSRDSLPSRQSAPSRSRSNDRASTSSRAATRSRASAPIRSSKSAPSRSSRSESTRSSRGSTSSRSRGGESRRSSGDSRRGGGRDRGEERR